MTALLMLHLSCGFCLGVSECVHLYEVVHYLGGGKLGRVLFCLCAHNFNKRDSHMPLSTSAKYSAGNHANCV